jgi:tetratricopeptide (TPR) repeat protein
MLEICTVKEIKEIIGELRKISANEKSHEVLEIINCFLKKAENLDDTESIIFLLDLKVRQYYSSKENIVIVGSLIKKIKELSLLVSLDEGICLAYQLEWHVEKLKGKKDKNSKMIESAIEILNQKKINDEYTYYGCKYSYALELWFENRDYKCASFLEECVNYFYSNGFYHGLAMSLGVLSIIYQQTQNKEKSMKLLKRILGDTNLLSKMPVEIQSIVYYFIGVSHKLSFNLNEAEKHLMEAKSILKPIYKRSVYSGYYLTTLSHLTATYALQGKIELANKQMKEVEELIEEGIATKNLDSFNKKQIAHTFNLVKFYIQSRLYSFQIEDLQDLVQKIVGNIDKYYSNAMFFSEFLLNSDLSKDQLMKIKSLDNQSINRIEHIINFLLEQTPHIEEKQIIKSISILRKKETKERITYVEKAFADLIAAREYYKIKRFAEISPLLKQYKNRLHRIEVLEMRIFMESFIQVGAYMNGDPLGPALQYMAIKKCRLYGFSRLENKLLEYLQLQHNEITKAI